MNTKRFQADQVHRTGHTTERLPIVYRFQDWEYLTSLGILGSLQEGVLPDRGCLSKHNTETLNVGKYKKTHESRCQVMPRRDAKFLFEANGPHHQQNHVCLGCHCQDDDDLLHQLAAAAGADEVIEVVPLGGWLLQPVKCFPHRDHWWDQQPQGIKPEVIVKPLVCKDL